MNTVSIYKKFDYIAEKSVQLVDEINQALKQNNQVPYLTEGQITEFNAYKKGIEALFDTVANQGFHLYEQQ